MISFTRHRNKTYLLSAVLLTAAIISLAVFGLNLGIDFTGGTVLHLILGEEFTLAEVEAVLAPFEEMQGATLQAVHGEAV
jgi:preprotein translocase subunit SecF